MTGMTEKQIKEIVALDSKVDSSHTYLMYLALKNTKELECLHGHSFLRDNGMDGPAYNQRILDLRAKLLPKPLSVQGRLVKRIPRVVGALGGITLNAMRLKPYDKWLSQWQRRLFQQQYGRALFGENDPVSDAFSQIQNATDRLAVDLDRICESVPIPISLQGEVLSVIDGLRGGLGRNKNRCENYKATKQELRTAYLTLTERLATYGGRQALGLSLSTSLEDAK